MTRAERAAALRINKRGLVQTAYLPAIRSANAPAEANTFDHESPSVDINQGIASVLCETALRLSRRGAYVDAVWRASGRHSAGMCAVRFSEKAAIGVRRALSDIRNWLSNCVANVISFDRSA